ncbi:MAG: LuxR C-terminal-related transcriptional regulator [Candidatus Gastranaerophilaceae bacterium]
MINNFTFEQLVLSPLTKREIDILILLSSGYSNYNISEKLFVEMDTIDSHYKRMLSKFFLDWFGHCKSKATKRVRASLIWKEHKDNIVEQSKYEGLIQ